MDPFVVEVLSVVPWWLKYITGFGPVIPALMLFYVAWRQHKLSREIADRERMAIEKNVALELFDRRLLIFDGIEEGYLQVLREGGNTEIMEIAFKKVLAIRSKTLFLFNDDIFDQFKKCRFLVLEALTLCEQRDKQNNDVYEKFNAIRLEHIKKADEGIIELVKAFEPYLRFTGVIPTQPLPRSPA